MNKKEKALKDLSILASILAEQLSKIDEVELEIENKLNKIKTLTDPVEIELMNVEIKNLLDWWKENTGYDYDI
jgi:hypothetical protein